MKKLKLKNLSKAGNVLTSEELKHVYGGCGNGNCNCGSDCYCGNGSTNPVKICICNKYFKSKKFIIVTIRSKILH